MVSTRLLISKSSTLFTTPVGIAPSAPITIGTTVTSMFHSFLVLWQCPSTRLSPHLFSTLLRSPQGRQSSEFRTFSFLVFFFFFFFFFTMTRSSRPAETRRSVSLSTSQRILCVTFCYLKGSTFSFKVSFS